MKKIISLVLIGFMLSGCSMFRVHKMDVEQGNVIKESDVDKLRIGMTESQVREVMGNPVLVNIFSPHRLDYIYTCRQGYGPQHETRVICIFQNGRLKEILR